MIGQEVCWMACIPRQVPSDNFHNLNEERTARDRKAGLQQSPSKLQTREPIAHANRNVNSEQLGRQPTGFPPHVMS
jgi:hypothetical protein